MLPSEYPHFFSTLRYPKYKIVFAFGAKKVHKTLSPTLHSLSYAPVKKLSFYELQQLVLVDICANNDESRRSNRHDKHQKTRN